MQRRFRQNSLGCPCCPCVLSCCRKMQGPSVRRSPAVRLRDRLSSRGNASVSLLDRARPVGPALAVPALPGFWTAPRQCTPRLSSRSPRRQRLRLTILDCLQAA